LNTSQAGFTTGPGTNDSRNEILRNGSRDIGNGKKRDVLIINI